MRAPQAVVATSSKRSQLSKIIKSPTMPGFHVVIYGLAVILVLSIRMLRTIGEKPRRRPRVLYD